MHNRKQSLVVWCNVIKGRVAARHFNRSEAVAFAKMYNSVETEVHNLTGKPTTTCQVRKEKLVVG